MKTSCTPVSDLMLGPIQAYFPTACFLMGSLEREQWLNLEGLWQGRAPRCLSKAARSDRSR